MIGLAIAAALTAWDLDKINAQVNASHLYGERCETCGNGHWTCKDYARAKLDRLVASGVDPSKVSLLLADIDGDPAQWHVVVALDDGEALDSRFEAVQTLKVLKARGYAFRGPYRGLDAAGRPIREAIHAQGGGDVTSPQVGRH